MGNANISCDFQNLQFCRFEQKKTISSYQFAMRSVLTKLKKKAHPSLLPRKNRGRSEGWCPSGKYFAETGKIGFLRRWDLDVLEEQRWEGKLFNTLCDLVSFVQFKKHENQPWRSFTFSNVAGLLPKVTLLHGCFSHFLKLYRWYQFEQRIKIIQCCSLNTEKMT